MKTNIYTKIIILLLTVSVILAGCEKAADNQTVQTSPTMKAQKSDVQVEKTKKIVDMAGRTVEIPGEIKKAYATSQIGIIDIFTLNPEKLAGWGFALNDDDKKFIPSEYFGLPVLGTWSGKNGTGNIEEIIKVHPDVIFSIGTIDDSQKTLCEKIQKQTGIPVVMLDGPLEKLDTMYNLLGDLMGEKERAKELGDYCKETIDGINAVKTKIPDDKKAKVYYAEGPKGLETDPKGSFHTEVLDFVGGINVADVKMQGGFGRSAVSMEQLLKWNPEVIIVGYDKDAKAGFFKDVYSSKDWMSINAVKNKKVYSIPNKPFDWFDRPPSVNRIIGVKWLANLLYPDYFKYNIETEVEGFYEKFYHKKLTPEETKALLVDAGGK